MLTGAPFDKQAVAEMDFEKLSKRVSYVLRHAPWEYELELGDEGWASLDQLLEGLRSDPWFGNLDREHLLEMIRVSRKVRYEIRGGRIRALYGHSIPGKLKKKRDVPPDTLFHGTVVKFLAFIRQEGLNPMGRQYVHLSVDKKTAHQVASRRGRGRDVVILQIRAREAASQGIAFYEGNDQVWLADLVPPSWIVFPE